MRCKHQNGTLFVFSTVANCREVRNGIMEPTGENVIYNISGHAYECDNCGRRFTFTADPRLKWLRKIYEQLGGES